MAALREKAQARNVEIDLRHGLPEGEVAQVQAYWEQGLNRLVTEPLSFDKVVIRINAYLQYLASVEE